ncbi:RHE_PE00001 family protein [Mesorhizobium sp. M0494]|uniref:RHE_PE00001 family protein n=1 Tax=Mesorhizobium sp. M0494 TaxID=2956951 RepID=UPI00333AB825
MAYTLDKLPLETLIGPVARATAALTRLDERLARSPVRDGFVERQHFADAASALWLEGELVHVEDLVLHDAHMDIRAPTHELTRAHAVLRARRQIVGNKSDWALGRDGFLALTGRGGAAAEPAKKGRDGEGTSSEEGAGERVSSAKQDTLTQEFAEIDALLARSTNVLAVIEARPKRPIANDRPALVYDLDWDEDARLAEWQAVLQAAKDLPAVLRVALLIDAWTEIEVLQHAPWLGPLLAAALLRQTGTTANHLTGLHIGAQKIPRERRRARDRIVRLLAVLETIHAAASAGLKEHDRLVLARGQLERRLRSRRTNSKLPRLIDLVLARPLVSTAMVQKELDISRQGALDLVGELNLREITGRKRYQAWGVV